jgi:outer membrane protein OmpA-like peptidoglycan-associated protein
LETDGARTMLHAPIDKNKTKDNLNKTQSETESLGRDRSSGWASYSSLSLGGENRFAQAKQGNDRSQAWQPMSLSSLSQGGILQRKCACGSSAGAAGTCGECRGKEGGMLQTKLSIGASDDKYEQEADRVADEVISMSPNSVVNSAPPRIQRFTGQTTGQAGMVAPASVDSVLSSPGSPLEPGLQQDMEQRFGHDFSRVRIHTDAAAARSARDVNANAYTVGYNIVFGGDRFTPGTQAGRRLVAHELTHTLQQNTSYPGQIIQRDGMGDVHLAEARHEAEERRQRQREKQKEDERFATVFNPGSEFCTLKKGMMQWQLYPATSADGKAKKQRIQIKFSPNTSYWNKTITFLQTLRENGADGFKTTIDIGTNQSVFRLFYGVNWDEQTKQWVPSKEGGDIGFKSQPNSADDPAAYLFDEPYFFPPPHGRVFESVAVVLETGETLGALTWGVGKVPAYAEKPKCADEPSADFHATVEKFYTPKNPAPGQGQENYDLILDGFAPNDYTLTGDQKKQLDSIVARVKEIITRHEKIINKDPIALINFLKKLSKCLVVGGFGDSMDTDPMAASDRRTQAVASYFSSKGVPKDALDLRSFGVTWARYEVSTKKAQEGLNRRVQIRLFFQ